MLEPVDEYAAVDRRDLVAVLPGVGVAEYTAYRADGGVVAIRWVWCPWSVAVLEAGVDDELGAGGFVRGWSWCAR